MKLRVTFSKWTNDQTARQLRGGAIELDDDDRMRPVEARIAEGVEELARQQLDGGAHRQVRVEPGGRIPGNPGGYAGSVTILLNAETDQHDTVMYQAREVTASPAG